MTTATDRIEHEQEDGGGAFYVMRDNRRVGEMTYERKGDVVVIDHTEVKPELRREGLGRALLDAFVAWARATGTKAKATCPFARAQFAKDPSLRDVLA